MTLSWTTSFQSKVWHNQLFKAPQVPFSQAPQGFGKMYITKKPTSPGVTGENPHSPLRISEQRMGEGSPQLFGIHNNSTFHKSLNECSTHQGEPQVTITLISGNSGFTHRCGGQETDLTLSRTREVLMEGSGPGNKENRHPKD